MIVLTCPSAPSAIAHECVAEVALISVIAVVTFTAVVEEPSAVIACDACFKPKKEGMLLKTSYAAIFLLIGVPVGSSTTWNKSADAILSPKSVNAVTFLSAIFFLLLTLSGMLL